MSLNYDLRLVVDHEKLDPTLKRNMIFTTMAIGLGEWTEKNIDEVEARVSFYEALRSLDGDGGLAPHVRKFVGLKTNVPNEKASTWLARMWKNHKADVAREARRTAEASA